MRLAQVQARRNGQGPLCQGAMLRTASYVVRQYWEGRTLPLSTPPCGHCGKKQRDKCREGELYSQCPRLPLSLNTIIEGIGGDTAELWETLADDRAIDLDAWVDARIWLTGCPRRLVDIAHKRASGIPLDRQEQTYLNHWQLRKAQKALF